ncbi:hypothetical protein NPIL_243891 [Nephila pilipes]|uniref:Uncharacterized protein n=1 Tax=Nephila pilipes TaxID=299642 RepID=A0A8X6TK45_NEPPI|nr:hypothetical protein NPIL_243891 [Nephila pilipes]
MPRTRWLVDAPCHPGSKRDPGVCGQAHYPQTCGDDSFPPCHQKRPLETPPCSIPKKVVKLEPSREDVCLLWRKGTIKTTQRKPEVEDFVLLYPNLPSNIW